MQSDKAATWTLPKIKILLGRKKAKATPGVRRCFSHKKNGFEGKI